MSATGQGGISHITLTLAAAGTSGSKYTFTHNVGKKLQSTSVVNFSGAPVSGISVFQISLNACVIQNYDSEAHEVVVALQWEELSTKLNNISSVSGDPRFASGTSSKEMWVATTGSDTTGDGTAARPFLTVQKAVDQIPNPYEGLYTINVGAGTFEAPTVFPRMKRGADQGFTEYDNILIIGDRTTPVFSNIDPGSVALVAGTATTYRANVGAYGISITSGGYWIASEILPGIPYGLPLLASASPNIDMPGATLDTATVYAWATNFTAPPYLYAFSPPLGVVFVGIVFPGYVSISANGAYFWGCKFDADISIAGTYSSQSLVSPVTDLIGRFAGVIYAGGASLLINGEFAGAARVSARGSQLKFASLVDGGTASSPLECTRCEVVFEGIDIKRAAATTWATLTDCLVSLSSNLNTLAGSTITRLFSFAHSYFTRTGGTITGSTAGVPVVLTDGSQVTGIKTAANGSLTNSSAAGNEITVGGNAVTTFAALPTTDVGAGAPQFCRAT